MSDVFVFNENNYAQLSVSLPGDISNLINPVALNDDEEGGGTAGAGTSVDGLWSLRTLLGRFLRGPLPPPSFDQFVLASNAISSQVNQEVYDELLGDTDYGRAFGNLVTLGTLHLCPAGPEVDAFVAYAKEHTSTFGRGYFRHMVHKSEKEALAWIDKTHMVATPKRATTTGSNSSSTTTVLSSLFSGGDDANSNGAEDDGAGGMGGGEGEGKMIAERTWVLVVFDSLEVGQVDYTLRFNYSTVRVHLLKSV
jgi:hypothetical protein